MDPEMKRKIDDVLGRVKEPETLRSLADLNLVKRLTYSPSKELLLVALDVNPPRAACMVCGLVTNHLRESIARDLREELEKEFPTLSIEIG